MLLMGRSFKGIWRRYGRRAWYPARQLAFWLGLQYRTAWHLSHRIYLNELSTIGNGRWPSGTSEIRGFSEPA